MLADRGKARWIIVPLAAELAKCQSKGWWRNEHLSLPAEFPGFAAPPRSMLEARFAVLQLWVGSKSL
jgi:hypothetical protein